MEDVFKNIKSGKAGYSDFQDILSCYRYSRILFTFHQSGIVDFICDRGSTGKDVCDHLGWDLGFGLRFLDCLCELGVLVLKNRRYFPSDFARDYFSSDSKFYQGSVFPFEEKLIGSWQTLDETLTGGERIFSVKNKKESDYKNDLGEYLNAMDAAAMARSFELWDAFSFKSTGTIMDAGAGSGAYLSGFLSENPAWKGIFCDLEDVIGLYQKSSDYKVYRDRLQFVSCNLLSPVSFSEKVRMEKVDLILLSNLIHCQGGEETLIILKQVTRHLKKEGVMVIHDFFSDSVRGAMYDIHMMLNTYNGRTYNADELTDMLSSCGLTSIQRVELASGTSAFCAAYHEKDLPEMANRGDG